jgi:signal transduction histidine kinase
LSGQAVSAGFDLTVKSDLVDTVQEIEVNVVEGLFIQIVINLVDNAIKYSNQSDTKKIDIIFSVQDKQELTVNVSDYGHGVELEQ